MKDLEFKNWINETAGMGLRGLLRGTCGDKSCSRGSGRGWDPDRDNAAKSPSMIHIVIPGLLPTLDKSTKAYFNPDENKLMLADEQDIYKNKNYNNLSVQFVQKAQELINSNFQQILSFINNYNQKNKSETQYKNIRYVKYFRAQYAVMVEFELS